MKVQELLANISNKDFDIERELDIKKYLPIMDKRKLATSVIAACTDDIDDFITVNRFKMNICLDMYVLREYTNIEIATDFNEMIEQYDRLCKNGVFEKIIKIVEADYNKLHSVLEDELKELLTQNSVDVQIVRIANKINKIIDVIGEKLGDVDFNNFLPEGVNIEDFSNIIDILK